MGIFLAPDASVRRVLDRFDVRGAPLVVGVSGGVDSVCLLHILADLADVYRLRLHVVHVHHGIRGEDADADAAFVREMAAKLGLPFILRHVDIPTAAQQPGVSVEEAARQWRYAILGQEAERVHAPWVAVAHNADDQVETVLMHVIRGAGLAGLRGMRPLTWYGYLRLPLVPPQARPRSERLWLLRPLLWARRPDIETWVEERHLPYRFDLSNLDTTYFRNRLRHQVLPLLEEMNPQVRAALYATGELAAADFDLLHPLSVAAWAETLVEETPRGLRFSLARWRSHPLAHRRAILRDAVMYLRRELRDIGFAHVERAREFLENPAIPAGSEYTLPAGLTLRKEYETFWVGEGDEVEYPAYPLISGRIDIPTTGVYPLGEGWHLRVTHRAREEVGEVWRHNPDPWTAYFDADRLHWPLHLRPREEGERMEPLGMPGKQVLVSEIMINAKIPRWVRDRWPLLVDAAGTVHWIVGVRQAHTSRITPDTRRVLILRVERSP
ncbi:MAG: tRNA lysidine(34) synthetase TilS [Chloroflexi bacterium]|nr:tRNA lysidine(34) synthetase TilS [Chloroflexota bacterium]